MEFIRRVGFQSLIGILQTLKVVYAFLPALRFQSLIGILQTLISPGLQKVLALFQSLIGILQTRLCRVQAQKKCYVSIPYRYSTNKGIYSKRTKII